MSQSEGNRTTEPHVNHWVMNIDGKKVLVPQSKAVKRWQDYGRIDHYSKRYVHTPRVIELGAEDRTDTAIIIKNNNKPVKIARIA